MGSPSPRAPSLLLLISDVNALNSFLWLSKRSRPVYALFSQCQLGARARSRDSRGTRKGPACRFRPVPTSPPSSSFGTGLNSSQSLNPPLWCVDPRCHGINQNVIKRGLNEIFLRPVIWVHCSLFLLCLSGGLIWARRWRQQQPHRESCSGAMGNPSPPMSDFPFRTLADWFLKSAWVVNHVTNHSTRKHLQSPLRLSECSPLPKGTREMKCTPPPIPASHVL